MFPSPLATRPGIYTNYNRRKRGRVRSTSASLSGLLSRFFFRLSELRLRVRASLDAWSELEMSTSFSS